MADPIAFVTDPTYLDEDVVNGTEYFYVVRARDAIQHGPVSNETSAIPVISPSPGEVIVSDSFTRDDGALTGSMPEMGDFAWELMEGSAPTITSGEIGIGSGYAHSVIDSGESDVRINVNVSNGRGGLVARQSDASNCLYFQLAGTGWKLTQRIDGTETDLASGSLSSEKTAEFNATLEVVGSNAVVWLDDIEIVRTSSVAVPTSTKHGIRLLASGSPKYDDFIITRRIVVSELTIGDSMMGGYFAGVMNPVDEELDVSDAYQQTVKYALIVSDKNLQTSSTWQTAHQNAPAAKTRWNGLLAQRALASASFPAFQYCSELTSFADGGSEWYLPAIYELAALFHHFKPKTNNNATGNYPGSVSFMSGRPYGESPVASPALPAQTAALPGQTALNDFQANGGQDFDSASGASPYWSATEGSSSLAAITNFDTNTPDGQEKTVAALVRPVRRVVIA